jgi:hypothetical protein
MTALTRNRQDPVEIPYLARGLGCELEYDRRRPAKAGRIYLPDGLEMAGSHDVDALHYECKLDVNSRQQAWSRLDKHER